MMVICLFALKSIPRLFSVYIACSHISQAPLTEALARLASEKQWQETGEKGKARGSCPVSQLHRPLVVTVSQSRGSHFCQTHSPMDPATPSPYPCLRLVLVSVQCHCWLVPDNSSLS